MSMRVATVTLSFWLKSDNKPFLFFLFINVHETPAEDKTTRDKFDELTNKWIEFSIKAFDLNLLKRSLEKLLTEESMEELECSLTGTRLYG
ncbi:unnamed protein product [Rhizopus microsporus]